MVCMCVDIYKQADTVSVSGAAEWPKDAGRGHVEVLARGEAGPQLAIEVWKMDCVNYDFFNFA